MGGRSTRGAVIVGFFTLAVGLYLIFQQAPSAGATPPVETLLAQSSQPGGSAIAVDPNIMQFGRVFVAQGGLQPGALSGSLAFVNGRAPAGPLAGTETGSPIVSSFAQISGSPADIDVDNRMHRLYVAVPSGGDAGLVVFDTNSLSRLGVSRLANLPPLPGTFESVGGFAQRVTVNDTTGMVYVGACFDLGCTRGFVAVFNGNVVPPQPVATVDIGGVPGGMDADEGSNQVFVAVNKRTTGGASGSGFFVTVINGATNRLRVFDGNCPETAITTTGKVVRAIPRTGRALVSDNSGGRIEEVRPCSIGPVDIGDISNKAGSLGANRAVRNRMPGPEFGVGYWGGDCLIAQGCRGNVVKAFLRAPIGSADILDIFPILKPVIGVDVNPNTGVVYALHSDNSISFVRDPLTESLGLAPSGSGPGQGFGGQRFGPTPGPTQTPGPSPTPAPTVVPPTPTPLPCTATTGTFQDTNAAIVYTAGWGLVPNPLASSGSVTSSKLVGARATMRFCGGSAVSYTFARGSREGIAEVRVWTAGTPRPAAPTAIVNLFNPTETFLNLAGPFAVTPGVVSVIEVLVQGPPPPAGSVDVWVNVDSFIVAP